MTATYPNPFQQYEPIEEPTAGDVFTYYQNNIEMLTPYNAEVINEWLDEVPPVWCIDAMKTSIENRVRKPAYINAILKRWQTDGKEGPRHNTTTDYATMLEDAEELNR